MTKIKYERVKLNPSEVEAGNGEEIEMKLETQIRKPKKHHHYITAAIEGRKQSNFISTIVVTTSLVLCYFILSIGLTFYQRTLLKVSLKNYFLSLFLISILQYGRIKFKNLLSLKPSFIFR